ncbi:hypothetical protein J7J35_00425 [Candidatus Bipolaricaulota bacterium]|nr:hypothetical protein [Candidatus Bipolaricaulota bacterium]
MKQLRCALVLALVASVFGQGGLRPAELGAGLAQLLSAYAPVELYRQRIALTQLAGGTEPDPGAALDAFKRAEELLGSLGEALSDAPGWEGTYQAVVTARNEMGSGMGVLQSALEKGLSALEEDELKELLGTLGQVRSAVDDVVLAASRDAEAQGQGWPFQVAFLAQTVLLSPSPLYLNIEESWAAYLAGERPPGIPPEGVAALDRLLELANRVLSEEEEEQARGAAQYLLDLLLAPEGGKGGA